MNSFKALILSVFVLSLFSCRNGDNVRPDSYGIFQIVDENTVEMDGEIKSSTLRDFNEMIADYPDINTINIIEVPGSNDDEVNLQVSQKVHDRNIATHLMDDGIIASGGVDFFLAGTIRTQGSNTMIGVHSWTDDANEATDFPQGHANHQPYIDYYQSVGFTQTEAEDFYYFTINAAPSSSIHYMTAQEIALYKILTP